MTTQTLDQLAVLAIRQKAKFGEWERLLKEHPTPWEPREEPGVSTYTIRDANGKSVWLAQFGFINMLGFVCELMNHNACVGLADPAADIQQMAAALKRLILIVENDDYYDTSYGRDSLAYAQAALAKFKKTP
ncbi:MAG: hypothetical protein JRI80_00315 [Deltaproteobacteria bacterium]|nr:hypothetical protein [Deltaproteobacteria bacterium]